MKKIMTGKWQEGDVAYNIEGNRFNCIIHITTTAPPTIVESLYYCLRPDGVEDMRAYAVAHPDLFDDFHFQQYWGGKGVTLESLDENDRFFMKYRKGKVEDEPPF